MAQNFKITAPTWDWLDDETRYTKVLHKNLTKLWYDASREAVRRMATPEMIRVLTGMSKGSLLPLARKLRIFTEVRSSIQPLTRYRQGYFDIAGNFVRHGTQSISQGERLGQRAYVLETGTPSRPDFRFEFHIVVYQYLLHENGLAPGTGPWRSLDAGYLTFTDFIAQRWKDYVPNLSRWLLTGEIADG